MADARWEHIKAIFRAALAVDDAERRRLLDRECAGDDDLRREVESLLAANTPGPVATGAALDALDARDSGISTVATTPLIERPGQKIGPYKLLQKIGEGGFGVVFMAEQDVPVRRRVALKVIKLGMDTRQVVARFEQERQALALMDHPHIAKVLDAGATNAPAQSEPDAQARESVTDANETLARASDSDRSVPTNPLPIGRPYFVMEYVVGDPITTFADAHKLTIRDRLGLFAQVCAAVQHAHTKGVIHRDLKPRNVLVSMVDGRPHAKVIDFGIAKATGARLTDMTLFTEHRQLIGTPEYMSPEQAEGSPDIDTRTDVYALGVLLYELLTGATPFDARRLRSAAFGEMQRIIKEEEPPMPSVRLMKGTAEEKEGTKARRHEGTEGEGEGTEARRHKGTKGEANGEARRQGRGVSSLSLRASVPSSLRASFVKGELDWIVMKALEKDRARRYESPNQLAADVQRHLSGEPVVAAPPSMAYRVRKFVRKHRGAVATASMVAAALVVGMAGTTWGLMRAAEKQRETDAINLELAKQTEAAEWNAYTAALALAQGALTERNFPLARRYLQNAPTSRRGWEYTFLESKARHIVWETANDYELVRFIDNQRLLVDRNIDDDVASTETVAAATGEISPDGEKPQAVPPRLMGCLDSAGRIAISPAPEWLGRYFPASAGSDSSKLWLDAPRLLMIDLTSRAIRTRVHNESFSPDGTRLVYATSKNVLRMTSVDQWGGPERIVEDTIALSDPNLAVVPGFKERRVEYCLGEHFYTGLSLTTPDGSRRITGGPDKTIRFFDARHGKAKLPDDRFRELAAIGLPVAVTNLQMSADGQCLVIHMANGSALLWDVRNPEERRKNFQAEWAERMPAGEYLEALWTSVTPDDELLKVVIHDETLPPLRRLVAAEMAAERLKHDRFAAIRHFDELVHTVVGSASTVSAAEASNLEAVLRAAARQIVATPRVQARVVALASEWRCNKPHSSDSEQLAAARDSLHEESRRARLAEAAALYFRWSVEAPYQESMQLAPFRNLPGDARPIAEMRQALSIREEILGRLHADTVDAMWSLGIFLCEYSDPSGVELLLEAAILKETLGIDGDTVAAYATLCSEATLWDRFELVEFALRRIEFLAPQLSEGQSVTVWPLPRTGVGGEIGTPLTRAAIACQAFVGYSGSGNFTEAARALSELADQTTTETAHSVHQWLRDRPYELYDEPSWIRDAVEDVIRRAECFLDVGQVDSNSP